MSRSADADADYRTPYTSHAADLTRRQSYPERPRASCSASATHYQMPAKKRLVIVGGGAAGVALAQAVSGQLDVHLVDSVSALRCTFVAPTHVRDPHRRPAKRHLPPSRHTLERGHLLHACHLRSVSTASATSMHAASQAAPRF